jgi:hypothetical protein
MEDIRMEYIIAIIALHVVFAIFTGRLAHHKGFDEGRWFAAGFFFSLVGLITAAGLPDYSTEQDKDEYRKRLALISKGVS